MTKAAAAVEVVWYGAEALRQFLVPVGDLDPFPGNPNRGNVEELRKSLRRFGQYGPIITDAADGRRITKGHHVRLAAIAEGWTHVAAVPNEFKDEVEARAALVGDNRHGRLGEDDLDLLIVQLQALAEADALEGTGYNQDDLDFVLTETEKLTAVPADPPEPPAAPEPQPTDVKEVVLFLTADERTQFDQWLAIVAKERGTSNRSQSAFAAARIAAETLNQA